MFSRLENGLLVSQVLSSFAVWKHLSMILSNYHVHFGAVTLKLLSQLSAGMKEYTRQASGRSRPTVSVAHANTQTLRPR